MLQCFLYATNVNTAQVHPQLYIVSSSNAMSECQWDAEQVSMTKIAVIVFSLWLMGDLAERTDIKMYKSQGFTFQNWLLESNRNFTVLYSTSWLHYDKKCDLKCWQMSIETSKWPQVSHAHSYTTSSLFIRHGFLIQMLREDESSTHSWSWNIQVHQNWKSKALSARKLRGRKDILLLDFMVPSSTFTWTTDLLYDHTLHCSSHCLPAWAFQLGIIWPRFYIPVTTLCYFSRSS